MVQKINGGAAAGQFLVGGLNFYKVITTLDITAQDPLEAGFLDDARQVRLDKLVETISLRAQPVILSAVVPYTLTADDEIGTVGGAAYALSFAIEHNRAWEVEGSSNPTLAESLDGVAGFIHKLGTTTNNNVTVTLVESL